MAEFNVWLLIVGLAAGAAVVWLVMGTIARNDDEVAAEERQVEAAWIARTIEEHGGRAPLKLVDQILTLHRRYLKGGPGLPQPEAVVGATAPTPEAGEPEAPEGPSQPAQATAAARRRTRVARPESEEPGEPVAS